MNAYIQLICITFTAALIFELINAKYKKEMAIDRGVMLFIAFVFNLIAGIGYFIHIGPAT